MHKYNAFMFVKCIYFFGLLLVIPFGWDECKAIQWPMIPSVIFLEIGFVAVFTTFFTYFFNLVSLGELKPTTVVVLFSCNHFLPLFCSDFEKGLVDFVKRSFCGFDIYLVTKKKKALPE